MADAAYNVRKFALTTYFPDDRGPSAVISVLTTDASDLITISTSFAIAAEIAVRFSEVCAEAGRAGQPISAPQSAETIERFLAERDGDNVLIYLHGARSVLLGHLSPVDARQLAALLTAAAEGSPKASH